MEYFFAVVAFPGAASGRLLNSGLGLGVPSVGNRKGRVFLDRARGNRGLPVRLAHLWYPQLLSEFLKKRKSTACKRIYWGALKHTESPSGNPRKGFRIT